MSHNYDFGFCLFLLLYMSIFAFFVLYYWEQTNLVSCSAPVDRCFSARCAEIGLQWLQADCEHLFSSPQSMTASWWIEISHYGQNYIMEIGKCYRVILSYDREPFLFHSTAHHCIYIWRFLFIHGSYPTSHFLPLILL